jgi:hypothetical protein
MTDYDPLSRLHNRLVTELASTLDLEAGLTAAALKHEQHRGVLSDLASTLDIGSGLRDALAGLPQQTQDDRIVPTRATWFSKGRDSHGSVEEGPDE